MFPFTVKEYINHSAQKSNMKTSISISMLAVLNIARDGDSQENYGTYNLVKCPDGVGF